MKYTIYAIAHPITEAPRYVGLTTRTLKERMVQHWNSRGGHLPMQRWMLELEADGLRPIIYELEKTEDTYLAEAKWIEYFRRQGFWVYNQHQLNYSRYVPHPDSTCYCPIMEEKHARLYPDASKTIGIRGYRKEYELSTCKLFRE